MPVVSTPASSTLQLRLHTGTDDKGNPIIRTRTYRNVKVNALDEDVHAVGMAMVQLQQHPVESIRRVNEMQLDSE